MVNRFNIRQNARSGQLAAGRFEKTDVGSAAAKPRASSNGNGKINDTESMNIDPNQLIPMDNDPDFLEF